LGSFGYGRGGYLLERAWKACERADLTAYEKVLEETKTHWAAIEHQAAQRLDQLDKDLEDEKNKLGTKVRVSRTRGLN
jgi:hypothetical protein